MLRSRLLPHECVGIECAVKAQVSQINPLFARHYPLAALQRRKLRVATLLPCRREAPCLSHVITLLSFSASLARWRLSCWRQKQKRFWLYATNLFQHWILLKPLPDLRNGRGALKRSSLNFMVIRRQVYRYGPWQKKQIL